MVAVCQYERFGCHDPLVCARCCRPCAEDERTNSIRVAEREQTVPGNHCNHRIGTLNPVVQLFDRVEHMVSIELKTCDLLLQCGCQNVEKHLGVAGRVHVTAIDGEEFIREFAGVGEVAVVNKEQAIGGIHIKRLCS